MSKKFYKPPGVSLFLPQFISPSDPVLRKSMLLAAIHFIEGILWLATVVVMTDRARRLLVKARVRRWLDSVCGAVFIAFGARLAVERG